MEALIIGGTRNLGPEIVAELMAMGFSVTVFHRGRTNSALPSGVVEILGDRTIEADLRRALAGRSFDLVVDTTLYTGPEAAIAGRVFRGRVGRYIMISTGQVYLVRIGPKLPFSEDDYDGPVMPDPGGPDTADWQYGVEKRAAEEALFAADLPVTVLRLPMVHSVRDHYRRLAAYWGRIRDGGPILIPVGPHLAPRHIYGGDVIRCIGSLARSQAGLLRAYNLAQDDAPTLEEFLAELARLAGRELRVHPTERNLLEAEGLLLDCSPFSGRWMSTLDNTRSKRELGMTFTPWREYLALLAPCLSDGVRQENRGREWELAAAR